MALPPPGQPAYLTTGPASALTNGEIGDDRRTWLMNHASWGAIIAGVIAALLVQLMLSLLGVGIGLASFQVTGDTAANPSAGAISVTAGIWWVVSGLIGSLVGGITAGRLCGSARHGTAGWHGFVTWCATTLVVVWLLGTAIGSIVGGTFSAIGSTLSGAGKAAGTAVGGAAKAADPSALEAQVRRLVNPNDAQSVQDSVMTYVQASVGGDQKAADEAKGRAVESLAKAANVSPEEAQNRLNQLQTQYEEKAKVAAQQAKDAAEKARKGAVEGALFAVAALLFGMIAAIVGGGLGTPRPAMTMVGATRIE